MAQAQQNGAARTTKHKSSVSRVIPAIPHALNAKRRSKKNEEPRASGESRAADQPAVSAEPDLETVKDVGNEINIEDKDVEVSSNTNGFEKKQPEADDEAPHVPKGESGRSGYTNGSATAGAQESVVEKSQEPDEAPRTIPMSESRSVIEGELVDVKESETPRVTARSPYVKSPVVFGGSEETDTFPAFNEATTATSSGRYPSLPT